MIAAALITMLTASRFTAIIAVGVVGYAVSLFFVLFRAPDLALTQLIVETVSVSLFLLCFYHLPKLQKDRSRPRFKWINFLVSAGVGAVITIIAMTAQGIRPPEPISRYFIENSHDEAGGDNVVNVILVDFRGFDTMLEILVLGIAALGVYALIRLRLSGGLNDEKK